MWAHSKINLSSLLPAQSFSRAEPSCISSRQPSHLGIQPYLPCRPVRVRLRGKQNSRVPSASGSRSPKNPRTRTEGDKIASPLLPSSSRAPGTPRRATIRSVSLALPSRDWKKKCPARASFSKGGAPAGMGLGTAGCWRRPIRMLPVACRVLVGGVGSRGFCVAMVLLDP